MSLPEKKEFLYSPSLRYMGIEDDLGLELIVAFEHANVTTMELRCRYGTEQHRRMWAAVLTHEQVDQILRYFPKDFAQAQRVLHSLKTAATVEAMKIQAQSVPTDF